MKDEKFEEDEFKVGVLGDDARAAAIVQALCGKGVHILVIGDKTNPQIAKMAQCVVAKDSLEIVRLMACWSAELVLASSEKYLAAVNNKPVSIVDMLESHGIPVAAPGYLPALIELDKGFMVNLLIKHGMGKYLPESKVLNGAVAIGAALKTIDDWKEVAIKPAGLTGGKGVKVTGVQLKNTDKAKNYVRELLLGGQKIVIQRKITGREFSLQGFVYKGGWIVFAPLVMDFKQLLDGVIMPNPYTGGMGSINYANGLLPFVTRENLKEAQDIMKSIVTAIEEETGEYFKGPIYGQFTVGDDGCIYIIEVNARLGNSEAMNILPLLAKGVFLKICRDMVRDNPDCDKIVFRKKARVVKYVVPSGYPGNSQPVLIKLKKSKDPAVELFFGGVIEDKEGNLITDGSRAIAVGTECDDVVNAAKAVNKAIPEIFAPCIKELNWRPGIGLEN